MGLKIPINLVYEQDVLAGMMNNDECYYDALAEVTDDHFADENTKYVYNELVKDGRRIPLNVLTKRLTDPRLKIAARTIDSSWVNSEEFEHSLKGLQDTHLKRQLYYTLHKVAKGFDDSKGDDIIATIQNDISSYQMGDLGDNMIFPEDRAPTALTELHERLENPDLAKGLPYSIVEPNGTVVGLPSLDKAFYGAHGGDLIMIAGKTGEGKTAFAINLARHFSFKLKHWGYYQNTEMRIEELEARILAPIADVRANEILHGLIDGSPTDKQDKRKRMDAAYNQYLKSKLVMSRIPDLPLHKAKGLAKQLKGKLPELKYLIVDYVGRMEVTGFRGSSWDELYEITKQLKELAITLDIPIFILAQRNQDGDVEGAKKMMNECDGVLYFEPTTPEDDQDIINRISQENVNRVNYKIVKKKVRRDDNPYPIYVVFDKAKNFINEVT